MRAKSEPLKPEDRCPFCKQYPKNAEHLCSGSAGKEQG